MSQAIIRMCPKGVKEQSVYRLFIVGLNLFLPGRYKRRYARYIGIAMLTAGSLYLDGIMSNTHAASEMRESGKILEVDDSENVPVIEEEPTVTVSTKEYLPENEIVKYFDLGVYYQKQGDTIRAIEEYERVLQLDPDHAETHNNLGVIYKERNELDKAMEHYQRVVSLNPGMDEAHNNLGVMHYLRGEPGEAVAEYRKALELNPDNLISQINISLVFKAQGQEKRAIEILENVLSIEQFHPEAHYNLAIIYERSGALEKAIWHYTRFADTAGKDYLTLIGTVSEHIADLKVTSGEVLIRD
jgi:tetratricopeptide (TPR) repeat protein